MSGFEQLSTRTKLLVLATVNTVLLALLGAAFFWMLDQVAVNGPLYVRIVQGKDLIADVLPPPEYLVETHLVVLQLAATRDATQQQRLIARGRQLRADYAARHEFWLRELEPGSLKDQMTVAAHDPAEAYFRERDDEFLPAVLAGDTARIGASLARLEASYELHRAAIDRVVTLAAARNAVDESRGRGLIRRLTLTIGVSVAVALLAVVLLNGLLHRSLARMTARLVSEFQRVREAVSRGRLAERAEGVAVHREHRVVVDAVNEIIERLALPLNIVSQYLRRIAVGDIPPKLEDDWLSHPAPSNAVQADQKHESRPAGARVRSG
jgi:methyl-accepting chemotaxis protein